MSNGDITIEGNISEAKFAKYSAGIFIGKNSDINSGNDLTIKGQIKSVDSNLSLQLVVNYR